MGSRNSSGGASWWRNATTVVQIAIALSRSLIPGLMNERFHASMLETSATAELVTSTWLAMTACFSAPAGGRLPTPSLATATRQQASSARVRIMGLPDAPSIAIGAGGGHGCADVRPGFPSHAPGWEN